jgi:cell division transport system permease protein
VKSHKPTGTSRRPARPDNSVSGAQATPKRPVRPSREQMRAERDAGRHQGAIQSQTSWRDQLDAWSAHHSNSAIESLLRLFETPLQSAMTWLVIAIAIALPATLMLVADNVQQLSKSWQDSSQISVYLNKGVSDTQGQALRQRWSLRADVGQVTYLSPAEALAEYKAGSGLGELLDRLDENPLPGVILITPNMSANAPSALAALEQALSAESGVAEVRLDMLWVKRLHQFSALVERFVVTLAVMLGLGVLLVIGNTIRMAIDGRREEILVVKLVGGTDAYVRRPFLYTGLWYGVGGGLLAVLTLLVGFWWFSTPVAQLAELYQSEFRLNGLGLIAALQIILVAGVIGLVGAWIAVTRYLYLIKSR